MPLALESLAVVPVVMGLAFCVRSFGYAYSDVVVVLIEEEGAVKRLRQEIQYGLF